MKKIITMILILASIGASAQRVKRKEPLKLENASPPIFILSTFATVETRMNSGYGTESQNASIAFTGIVLSASSYFVIKYLKENPVRIFKKRHRLIARK